MASAKSLPAVSYTHLDVYKRQRLICAVGTPCRYAETIVEAECAGQKFRTKGKTVTDMGLSLIHILNIALLTLPRICEAVRSLTNSILNTEIDAANT